MAERMNRATEVLVETTLFDAVARMEILRKSCRRDLHPRAPACPYAPFPLP